MVKVRVRVRVRILVSLNLLCSRSVDAKLLLLRLFFN